MSLGTALADLLHLGAAPDGSTRAALARVVAIVGPVIAAASGFERRLAVPVRDALAFCAQLVDRLPGPLAIDRQAFAGDPLVHALFATPADIEQMLGRSQTLRDYLAATPGQVDGEVHALFATRRREKHTLGMALQGDMLRRDVPQTLLYFTDHTLAAVSADAQQTREQLRAAAFDSLLRAFAAHVDAIRGERQAVHDQRDAALAQPVAPAAEAQQQAGGAQTRRLAELEKSLRDITAALQADPLADSLQRFLLAPDQSLRLEPVHLCVDRNGVIADASAAATGSLFSLNFPELVARDRRRYLVTLARFSRQEAQRAVDKVCDQQRRFIII